MSSKPFGLNQKINTGDTEKSYVTFKLMGQEGKGNEENQVQSKKHKDTCN